MQTYENKLSIKEWAEADRPREKMLLLGSLVLSEAELIAILIRSGTKNESAVELSKRILHSVNNNLNELGKLNVKDLIKFNGIGEAKALSIVSALELGRRRNSSSMMIKETVASSADIFEVFHPLLSDLKHEEFWILLLNRANKIIKRQKISTGGVSGTVADLKLIFKTAIDNLASSLILCHNHPSGTLKPSEADVQLTKKCKESGKLLDIVVLDHVIIADKNYFSFADEGII